jgi:hypothetical protein
MSLAVERQLLGLARKLPAEGVREVMDFAQFLLARSQPRRKNGAGQRGDALERYIGGVKHGRLAQDTDEELYGRTVR